MTRGGHLTAERAPVYLNALGMINALGASKKEILNNLLASRAPGMGLMRSPISSKDYFVGQVRQELPLIPERLKAYDCRNNQLLLAAVEQIQSQINQLLTQFPANRIGIVLGTSTSGIASAEQALKHHLETGSFPEDYHYKKQEIGAIAEFLAQYLQVTGPAYTISTACSSSGKVFASARGLIDMDICDAVIVGGADSLCELTLQGFSSLEAISKELTNPFSVNRNGINIGEAAAVFVMSKFPGNVELAGVGESSDAHHISAPEPSGAGARASMLMALQDAGLEALDIDYINLHGTGTALNDSMESHAVYSVFADNVQVSSTKPFTGHTLGAAGATEAGLCWLLLDNSDPFALPLHIFDGQIDPKLSKIALCRKNVSATPVNATLSNSFAFGGNNVSVILKRAHYQHG